MQNICSINKETYLLREDNEKTLESEPNSSRCVQRNLSTEEKYYSDSELKIISKKRSPFVRAFRSFSRSSNSKGKLRCTLKKNKSTEVSNQSNGYENFDESLKSTEKKQRNAIFLGAFTKSKITPSETGPSNDGEKSVELKVSTNQLQDLKTRTDSKIENNDSETSAENKQRLQIIISGKKVDPHILSESESIPSLAINSTEAKAGRTNRIDQNLNNITTGTKFKSKKITSVVALTHRKKEPRPSISKNSLYSSVSREKITITQNLCDTPPSERAPTKPGVTASEGEKKVEPPGSFSKSVPRSVTQTNSLSNRRLTSSHQRIETNIKKIPPTDHLNSAEVVSSKPHVQDINRSLAPNKVKLNLMQEPSSSINRGHRFPKPSKVLAVIGKETKPGHIKIKNTGNEKSLHEKQTQPSQPILIEHTSLTSDIKSNCGILDTQEKPIKAESIEINERSDCLESGENSTDSNSEIQNSSKENRRRIRYVAPSIFDVYDSLTASSAIEQTEKVHLGVISEDKLDNKCDEISKESMSSQVNLSKDVQIEAVSRINKEKNVAKD